jgi:hypothetical protein
MSGHEGDLSDDADLSKDADLSDDTVLLEALGAALDEVDPVPAAAVDLAVAGFALRNLDEQLAQLVEDSSLGAGVLLRRDQPTTRALRFAAPALTIEVDLDAVDGSAIGVLTPPQSLAMEMETVSVQAGRRRTEMRSDDLGRFRAAIGPGLTRLWCRLPDGAAVVTPWFNA